MTKEEAQELTDKTVETIKAVFGKGDKPLIVWEIEKGNDQAYQKLMKEENDGASSENTKGI